MPEPYRSGPAEPQGHRNGQHRAPPNGVVTARPYPPARDRRRQHARPRDLAAQERAAAYRRDVERTDQLRGRTRGERLVELLAQERAHGAEAAWRMQPRRDHAAQAIELSSP